MDIRSDVLLKGDIWNDTIDKLSPIFKERTIYSIYILAISIGIMFDKRIENFDEGDKPPRNVPRTVLMKHGGGRLDVMYEAAILSTNTVPFTEQQRLEMAFGEDVTLKKMDLLTEFANYGIVVLSDLIKDSDLETMENIKNFLNTSVEGTRCCLADDDILLEE